MSINVAKWTFSLSLCASRITSFLHQTFCSCQAGFVSSFFFIRQCWIVMVVTVRKKGKVSHQVSATVITFFFKKKKLLFRKVPANTAEINRKYIGRWRGQIHRVRPSRSTPAENLEEDNIVPPIHTERFHTDGATSLIFVVNWTNAVNSFAMRSTISRNMVVPLSGNSTLAYDTLRMSMSHFGKKCRGFRWLVYPWNKAGTTLSRHKKRSERQWWCFRLGARRQDRSSNPYWIGATTLISSWMEPAPSIHSSCAKPSFGNGRATWEHDIVEQIFAGVHVTLYDVLDMCRGFWNTAGTTLPRNGNARSRQRWCFCLGVRKSSFLSNSAIDLCTASQSKLM